MITVKSQDLDIEKIADSGQCFRLKKTSENKFILAAHGKLLNIDAIENGAVFHCSQAEFDEIWSEYFDLNNDYEMFRKSVCKDDLFLQTAAEYGKGIRILKQDEWEMLITFIISQRKNIPAIQKSVEMLCDACATNKGDNVHAMNSFPTPEQVAALSMETLKACSLGYRAGYIASAAQLVSSGELNLKQISACGNEELHEKLLKVTGVGTKVANCVMLFGYHRLSGFPRDVWINRIIDDEYNGEFNTRPYSGFEGVIQQYMFYYARSEAYKISKTQ